MRPKFGLFGNKFTNMTFQMRVKTEMDSRSNALPVPTPETMAEMLATSLVYVMVKIHANGCLRTLLAKLLKTKFVLQITRVLLRKFDIIDDLKAKVFCKFIEAPRYNFSRPFIMYEGELQFARNRFLDDRYHPLFNTLQSELYDSNMAEVLGRIETSALPGFNSWDWAEGHHLVIVWPTDLSSKVFCKIKQVANF